MFRQLFAIAAVVMSFTPTFAAESSFHTARKLGSILGAEKACGLKFDQASVAHYIKQNVPADDKNFPKLLAITTRQTKEQLSVGTGVPDPALCNLIRRAAEQEGLRIRP